MLALSSRPPIIDRKAPFMWLEPFPVIVSEELRAALGGHPLVAEILVRRGLEPRFATLVVGRLSPDGKFVYSNAGHVPPLLLARDGIRRLTVGGPVLGALTESSFEEESLLLKPQDTVILFSDGVTEALDSTGTEFGDERLISCASELLTHSASEVLQGILSAVQDFSRGTTPADDITVAVTRFRAS